jgi:glycosyltransferase involved in cell wall biosynthesis
MIRVSVLISLYRCTAFLEPFLQHVGNTIQQGEVEFLLLHNDPLIEEMDIIERYKSKIPGLKHIQILEREGLYKTWNRGIQLAKGEYITIWNVDDIRFPDSIQLQMQALDDHPEAAIAYGDMYGTDVYGSHSGKLYVHPPFDTHRTEFFQSYLMSCFQMWRKSIHSEIGYYDEQFKCVADFDFQIRTALKYSFVKVEKPLGVYLENLPHKLSSNSVQALENNIVYLRYGVYKKILLPKIFKSMSLYKRNSFLFFGKWMTNSVRSPFSGFSKTIGAVQSILKMPKYYARLILK